MANERKTKDLFGDTSEKKVKDIGVSKAETKDILASKVKVKAQAKPTKVKPTQSKPTQSKPTQSKPTQPKPKTTATNRPNFEKPKPIDASFYTRQKENDSKGKISKKKKNWIIAGGVTVALGIGLGLGLGLGLRGGSQDSSIEFPGYGEDFKNWLEDMINASNENTEKIIEVKKDKAVVKRFNDIFDANGFENMSAAGRVKETARINAEDSVEQEKEGYQDNYGDTWNEEWEAYLIDEGYDSEDEYIESKEATELLGFLKAQVSTEDKYVIDTTDITGYDFASTISDSGESKVISQNTAGFNIENYMLLYLNTQKPIQSQTVSTNWSYRAGEENANAITVVEFDSVDSVENAFWILRDILDSGNTEFSFWNHNSSYDGIQKNGGYNFINDSVTNNIMFELLGLDDITPITTNLITDVNWAEDLNIAIGDELKSNGDARTWEGGNSTDGSTWGDVTSDSFVILNDGDLSGIGENFTEALDGKGIIDSSVYINPDDGSTNNITTKQKIDIDQTEVDTVFLTFANDGMHLTHLPFFTDLEINGGAISTENITYNNIDNEYITDPNLTVSNKLDGLAKVGGRMLSDDLNRIVDEDYAKGTPEAGIIGDFNSWLDTNLENIIFIEMLNDDSFVEDEWDVNVSSDPATDGAFFIGEDAEVVQDVVNNIYSGMHQDMRMNYITFFEKIDTFFTDNNDVFTTVDLEQVKGNIENEMVLWDLSDGYTNGMGFKRISIDKLAIKGAGQ